MKKLFAVLLPVLLISILALAACSNAAPSPATSAAPTTAAQTSKPGVATTIAPVPTAAAPTTAAAVKPIILKFGNANNAETSPQGQCNIHWMKKIENDSGGRIKFQYYFSASLISAANGTAEIAAGIADFGVPYQTVEASGFEFSKVIKAMFYGVKSYDEGVRIFKDVYNKFPAVAAEYNRTKVLAFAGVPFYGVSTAKKPVRVVTDFKGLTLKAVTQWIPHLAYLGASPIALPMGEAYQAIQKGTIDGLMTPIETMYNFKLAEVCKYHTFLNLLDGTTPNLVANFDSFNKLPKDLQDIILAASAYYETDMSSAIDSMTNDGNNAVKASGGEFITFTPAEMKKFMDAYNIVTLKSVAELDAKGYPATAVFNYIRGQIEGK